MNAVIQVKPEPTSEGGSHNSMFSAARVNRVVSELLGAGANKSKARGNWLSAVAARVTAARPDISDALLSVLGVGAAESNVLEGLSIGEVGVCYEALISVLDRSKRKNSGQFFTPDDAAAFMAKQSNQFGKGVWLDPCSGVGNLSWHLTALQSDPSDFIANRLILIDQDEVALKTAVALISADYSDYGDEKSVYSLASNSARRDFLNQAPIPEHDFSILNPPYARTHVRPGFDSGECRDMFALFVERVAKNSRGFIAVTPASYLSAPKFQPLRQLLDREVSGGDIYVFDNVPDTLFRGYKYGSNNSSKTNFVRAAITVSAPNASSWLITPILRWQVSSRDAMFHECGRLLAPRRNGPHGEWAKTGPVLEDFWESLLELPETLRDLTVKDETEFALHVGLTPRYFISATQRALSRGSKAVLYFETAEKRDRAAIVLNSSLPYLWWRALDGGVTLPLRVLMSVPMPTITREVEVLLDKLRASEKENLVKKLNAGRENENVKHPDEVVAALNEIVLPGIRHLELAYSNTMFPLQL